MKNVIAIVALLFLSIFLSNCQLLKEPAAKVMSVSLHTPEIDSTEKNFPLANYNLQVKDLKGNVVHMKNYRGKIIFLNFWATWCMPCVAELPSINRLYNQFKDENIVFLLISKEKVEKVQHYKTKKNYDVPFQIIDDESFIPAMYRAQSIPTTFIIDKEGQIVKAGIGAEDWDDKEFVEAIQKML